MNNKLTIIDGLVSVSKTEVLRYMGCANTSDASILSLADEAIETLLPCITPKIVFIRCPVLIEQDLCRLGNITARSRSLAKHLKECTEVFLLAATLGVGFDRLLNRLLVSSPALALATDNAGTAAIESILDNICDEWQTESAAKELKITSRFSPGYGDLPIDLQKEMLLILDANRKLGLTLTDGMMLAPTKSVTAIVGIKKGEKHDCFRKA